MNDVRSIERDGPVDLDVDQVDQPATRLERHRSADCTQLNDDLVVDQSAELAEQFRGAR